MARSNGVRKMFDHNGLATPPCGTPVVVGCHFPASITPASRKDWLAWLSLVSLAVCAGVTSSQMHLRVSAFSDLVLLDPYACFWKLLLYLASGLTILMSLAYLRTERIHLVPGIRIIPRQGRRLHRKAACGKTARAV